MVEFCKKITQSNTFKNFITVVIIIAAILVGISTYHQFSLRHQSILSFLNTCVLIVFILEVFIKVIAEGSKPWKYFLDPWNVFDFSIVFAAFLPFGGSSVAVLRLLRLLRVLKLINALPKLQMLVGALLRSIPSMFYVSILLSLLFYIYAVAGVFFFGDNDPVHFRNLQTSMLSLFRVVTLEDWTDIMYINMYGCENYGYDSIMSRCTASASNKWGAAIFFVSFVLIGTMIFLNLFIGVIMTGMDEAKSEVESKNKPKKNVDLLELESKVDEIREMISRLKIKKDS